MNNHDFIKSFVENDIEKAKNQNIFIEGRVLYDYGYHFPMALKLNNGYFLINSDKYSRTTTKHQNILKGFISSDKMILRTTREIKIDIHNNVTDIKEIIVDKLQQ